MASTFRGARFSPSPLLSLSLSLRARIYKRATSESIILAPIYAEPLFFYFFRLYSRGRHLHLTPLTTNTPKPPLIMRAPHQRALSLFFASPRCFFYSFAMYARGRAHYCPRHKLAPHTRRRRHLSLTLHIRSFSRDFCLVVQRV